MQHFYCNLLQVFKRTKKKKMQRKWRETGMSINLTTYQIFMDRYDNAPMLTGEFGITDQQEIATKVISSENATSKYLIFSCPSYDCCQWWCCCCCRWYYLHFLCIFGLWSECGAHLTSQIIFIKFYVQTNNNDRTNSISLVVLTNVCI